ncbi:hypothetical protein ENUP19_0219G0049 [Entamoeba nuttalli]|uniref:Protein kinase, putative n=2 Tax=Entamoeba nuttalli TaxID=412467 RepID=K2GV77_ENTNP|nr:protein kinase, putative [Entamoeba nuttalli P19]EKE37727.1 protein kinase, putative [Entamoeba nuttalli P19]|eukprot:XP_008859938.1 protein kinase, putative [Entamoeba nuttalli P19]
MLLIIIFINYVYCFKCSPGCINSCIADYTCDGCITGYSNDTSCITCKHVNPYSEINSTNPLYIMIDGRCSLIKNTISKTHWLPSTGIKEINSSDPIVITFNSSTPYDQGPCYNGIGTSSFKKSHWLVVDLSKLKNITDNINIVLEYTDQNNKSPIYIDTTSSSAKDNNPQCLTRFLLTTNESTGIMQIPLEFDIQEMSKLYIFAFVEDNASASISISIQELTGKERVMSLELTQKQIDEMVKTNTHYRHVFHMRNEGRYTYPICMPTTMTKVIRFSIEYSGNFSIHISTIEENRIRYLQEYTINSSNIVQCKKLWGATHYRISKDSGIKNGLNLRIEGNPILTKRYFALLTNELNIDIPVTFKPICIDNCNNDKGHGNCSAIKQNCICNDGYGGADCHLKCYHKGRWQVNDFSNLCKYGSSNCEENCICKKGYYLVDHYCLHEDCYNNVLTSNIECLRKNEGCSQTCSCLNGFVPLKGSSRCIPKKCGNKRIDTIIDNLNGKRREQCDSGTNCNQFCECIDGYEQNKKDPLSCSKKGVDWMLVSTLIITGTIIVLIFIILLFILLSCFIKSKKVDIEVYKQQQPNYYYYISGSSKSGPSKENNYYLEPLELDFGNSSNSTDIFDTRFENIVIKNHSKKKWLMIIFHTPNNPKFVFYFDPQVKFVSSKSTKKITVFMTLHCTTKIKNIKIPYTIWFSKCKKSLEMIADLLKNKTFEEWNQENQLILDKTIKTGCIKRMHYQFTIATDASSSTFLDYDELNIREIPIAEGAMGKVYIGEYRSVPVAVKEFHWDNLTEEEIIELKEEVIAECEMMSKLRNPFIANYMGSVTYLPQISMVMQFFVLGSLGEYVRKDNENFIRFPFKLKIKILFDTARGMQFLHENNIMHLDLKPDNLLVNSFDPESACCIKITDFGTSRMTKKSNKRTDKGLGTPVYLAPECYHDEYTFACDVYSFAITSWEVYYQEEPYKDFRSLFEIKVFVEKGKRLEINNTMPSSLKKIINSCWQQETIERPSFCSIVDRLTNILDKAHKYEGLDAGIRFTDIEDIMRKRTERLKLLLEQNE